jgi:hypothetical protein
MERMVNAGKIFRLISDGSKMDVRENNP